jgi:hypothetical protein
MFKDIGGYATKAGGLDAETIRRNTFTEDFDQDDGPKRRLLVGRSFVQYAQMDVPQEETLLGNRWLCRGGGALIVAPSGQGKSVLTAQASILWGCNKPAFGIKPSRPLRSLIL